MPSGLDKKFGFLFSKFEIFGSLSFFEALDSFLWMKGLNQHHI
jgi:hypothetical protein